MLSAQGSDLCYVLPLGLFSMLRLEQLAQPLRTRRISFIGSLARPVVFYILEYYGSSSSGDFLPPLMVWRTSLPMIDWWVPLLALGISYFALPMRDRRIDLYLIGPDSRNLEVLVLKRSWTGTNACTGRDQNVWNLQPIKARSLTLT